MIKPVVLYFLFAIMPILGRHDVSEYAYLELGNQYREYIIDLGMANGIALDSHWILTARHVASGIEAEELFILGRTYSIRNISIHPQNDVALIELNKPLEKYPDVSLYTKQDEKGKVVTFVGTGAYGNGKLGEGDEIKRDGRIRACQNKVHRVTSSDLVFSFSDPNDSDALAMEGISGTGDSGGPALFEEDGKVYVIGISSRQFRNGQKNQGMYGVMEYYTRISSVSDWITYNISR